MDSKRFIFILRKINFHTFVGYDEVPVEAPGATTTGPPTTSTTSSNAAFTTFTFALLSLILF
jgi:hypothetical protein